MDILKERQGTTFYRGLHLSLGPVLGAWACSQSYALASASALFRKRQRFLAPGPCPFSVEASRQCHHHRGHPVLFVCPQLSDSSRALFSNTAYLPCKER